VARCAPAAYTPAATVPVPRSARWLLVRSATALLLLLAMLLWPGPGSRASARTAVLVAGVCVLPGPLSSCWIPEPIVAFVHHRWGGRGSPLHLGLGGRLFGWSTGRGGGCCGRAQTRHRHGPVKPNFGPAMSAPRAAELLSASLFADERVVAGAAAEAAKDTVAMIAAAPPTPPGHGAGVLASAADAPRRCPLS